MAGEDGGGAIELLGENEACESVREGERTEGEEKLGASAGEVGPAVGGSDGEEDVGAAFVAAGAEPGCKSFGGEGTAAEVGQDEEGRADAIEGLEEGGLGLEGLRIAAGDGSASVEVDGDEGVVFVFGTRCDVGEGPLHGRMRG